MKVGRLYQIVRLYDKTSAMMLFSGNSFGMLPSADRFSDGQCRLFQDGEVVMCVNRVGKNGCVPEFLFDKDLWVWNMNEEQAHLYLVDVTPGKKAAK
jgi:hypothetical protein